MSGNYITPTPQSVTSLLAMIYGVDLRASSCDLAEVSGEFLATFINEDDKLVAFCICDLKFVTYSGAALSMIPSAAAEDMVVGNNVTETVANNFHEVMNICTKLLMSDRSEHLKLAKTMNCKDASDVLTTMESCGTQISFEVNFPGYGKGRMAFYLN